MLELNYDIEQQTRGVIRIFRIVKKKNIMAPRGLHITDTIDGALSLNFIVSINKAGLVTLPVIQRYDIGVPNLSQYADDYADEISIGKAYKPSEVVNNLRNVEGAILALIVDQNGRLTPNANNILGTPFDTGGITITPFIDKGSLFVSYETTPIVGLDVKNDARF